MRQDEKSVLRGPETNVIAMINHRPEARFPYIAEVEAYWHALRGNRLAPARAEIDPRGIARALERAFILEMVAPGVGRLRIAGTHLSDILGMEVRGMPLSAYFVPDARPVLARVLERVCTQPASLCLTLSSEAGIGKPPIEARLLLLPLRDAMGAMTRILGCFDTFGPLGRAPRRFAITASKIVALTGDADIPAETLASPVSAMQQWHAAQPEVVPDGLYSFHESQTPYDSGPQPDSRAADRKTGDSNATSAYRPPYLRLITPDPN